MQVQDVAIYRCLSMHQYVEKVFMNDLIDFVRELLVNELNTVSSIYANKFIFHIIS